MKLIGKRSAGNPHAAFDVAEAGNMICNGCVRQSSTLPAGERGGNEPLYPEIYGKLFTVKICVK